MPIRKPVPTGALAFLACTSALAGSLAAQEAGIPADGDSLASSGDYFLAEPPLSPGDAVELTSWREAELAGEYTVWDDGTVSLPLLGRRHVTDIPADELARRLEDEYGARFRENPVEVSLKRRVRVLGAVQRPGLYFVDRTMTAVDAVALAGGPTEDGDWKNVRIVRDGYEIETRLDAPAADTERLHSGDQIVLPRRSWLSRNSAMLVGGSVSAVVFVVAQLFVF